MNVAQKAEVLQKAIAALLRPLDIITLIDGSGSVSDDQFMTMKFCMRTLTTLFEFPPPGPTPPPARIGAVQFDSQSYLVCNLTNDTVVYNTAVVTMPQKRGGTNAGAGLRTCINLFKTDSRSASRVVFLFTDGDVKAAKPILAEAIQNGVRIISFGIGLPENAKPLVKEISDTSIFVATFDEMQEIVSRLSVQPSSPPKIKVRTRSAKKASFDIVYSDSFQRVEVLLLPAGSNEWQALPQAGSNVYYTTQLQPDTLYKVMAKVQTQGGAWSGLSAQEEFRTLKEHIETSVLKSANLPKTVAIAINEINTYEIPMEWKQCSISHVNIILLGNAGFGKSCYFNSIYSTLLGSYTEEQIHKDSSKTVTLTICKKFLTTNRNNCIRLWDTYGWTAAIESYEKEFEFLLEGAIPDGYKEGDEVLGKLNTAPQIGDKVHSIIVVYEMPAVMTESNMNAMKRFYQKMTAKNLQPIVILTKADLIKEAELDGARLSDIYDSGLIDVYISEFCKASSIPRSNVFPIVNFRGAWDQRDYVKERLILNAFSNAFWFAQRKVSALLEAKVVVFDKSDPTKAHKLAVVERGGTDDMLLPLAERIARVPGLDHFQIFLNDTRTAVPKTEYSHTKLLACAKASSHGYFEVYGQLVNPRLPSQGLPSAVPVALDNPVEIAIFTQDPRNAQNKSIGSIASVSPSSPLATLRKFIEEEIEEELPKSFGGKFQFAKLDGSKLSVVPYTDEATTKIASVLVFTQEACVVVTKHTPLEIGIYQEDCEESLGFLEDVPLTTTLDMAKTHIQEQTDIEFDFRFLTLSKNQISAVQERQRTLQSILEDGSRIVVRKL